MPLPVAHGLLGASIVSLTPPRRSELLHRKSLWIGAFLGICPDFDVFFSYVLNLGNSWHGSFSHSLVFSVVAGLLIPIPFGFRSLKGNLGFIAATASHGLLDAFTGRQAHAGEELFWPFSLVRFHLGLFDYFQISRGEGLLQTATSIATISLFELAIFLPLLILVNRFRDK